MYARDGNQENSHRRHALDVVFTARDQADGARRRSAHLVCAASGRPIEFLAECGRVGDQRHGTRADGRGQHPVDPPPDRWLRSSTNARCAIVRPVKLYLAEPGRDPRRMHGTDARVRVDVPGHPVNESWDNADAGALAELVTHCQRLGVPVIADNIFQDLRWSGERIPELFSLDCPGDFVCKVTSPSKDRPYSNGYRIGYALVAPELWPWVQRAQYQAICSPNALSMVYLAVDCMFRVARYRGGLTRSDIDAVINAGVLGYPKQALETIRAELLRRCVDGELFGDYCERVAAFEATVGSALQRIWEWLASSEAFDVTARPRFGSALFVEVRPEYWGGSDLEYFFDTIAHGACVGTPGYSFGWDRPGETWFRILLASMPVDDVIDALDRQQEFLRQKRSG